MLPFGARGSGNYASPCRMMGLPGGERSLTISSAVRIQYTNVTDGRTDGHRTTAKTALTHSVVRWKCLIWENLVQWRKVYGSETLLVYRLSMPNCPVMSSWELEVPLRPAEICTFSVTYIAAAAMRLAMNNACPTTLCTTASSCRRGLDEPQSPLTLPPPPLCPLSGSVSDRQALATGPGFATVSDGPQLAYDPLCCAVPLSRDSVGGISFVVILPSLPKKSGQCLSPFDQRTRCFNEQ